MNLKRLIIVFSGIMGLLLVYLRIEAIVNKWFGGLGFLLITISTYLASNIHRKNN